MRDMVKTTMPLLVICFCTALSLAFVNGLTKDTIKQRANQDAEEKRKQVMHAAQSFTALANWRDKDASGLIREVYAAYDGPTLVGYVFSAVPKGYGGEIKITVGVDAAQKISGVSIGENKETPGLGTKAAEPDFIAQYQGKDGQKALQVVKRAPAAGNEIQAISGATITSKAVTSAVQAALELDGKLSQEGGGKQ